MRILWVSPDFLHPTTRGGQVRTLEILRRLHRRHEIHFVALNRDGSQEALVRSSEYCTRAYPVPHFVPDKPSLAFGWQLFSGLFSPLPVAISRFRSPRMKTQIGDLLSTGNFDSLVCDFLFSAPNVPDLSRCLLFQHNVETVIWRRHAGHASNPVSRAYLDLQARRMAVFESDVCQRAGRVVAVSEIDAGTMRHEFGAPDVSVIATGIDLERFAPPQPAQPVSDLVFVGSMDWLPNIDGIEYFVREILPLIRARRPHTTLVVAGRKPSTRVRRMAGGDGRLQVTGTVPDIRPYLWGARVSIVPLRIGGGTRLKIYEAMAAGLPVVSTSVGAEGLALEPGRHLAIADTPEEFAGRCLRLLADDAERTRMVQAAYEVIASRFSWETVCAQFEEILRRGPRPC